MKSDFPTKNDKRLFAIGKQSLFRVHSSHCCNHIKKLSLKTNIIMLLLFPSGFPHGESHLFVWTARKISQQYGVSIQ